MEFLYTLLGVYLLTVVIFAWFMIADENPTFCNWKERIVFNLLITIVVIIPALNTIVLIMYMKQLRKD